MEQTSTEQAEAGNRRAHDRVAGPFDGHRIAALETPIRIYNLSEGGCFVNSIYEQPRGTELVLTIELPHEDPITVEGETLYHRKDFGFGVRFTEMTEQARATLARVLMRLRGQARGSRTARAHDRMAEQSGRF
jgi:hypothetical protein